MHEIDVHFKANTAGTPGTWDYGSAVTIHAQHPSKVLYRLTSHSQHGWFFERVAIGEHAPHLTDFIDVIAGERKELEFDGLVVRVEFHSDHRSLEVTIDGIPTRRMKMGVMLTVTDGRERHTSRDPQIVLEPDPPSGELRIPNATLGA